MNNIDICVCACVCMCMCMCVCVHVCVCGVGSAIDGDHRRLSGFLEEIANTCASVSKSEKDILMDITHLLTHSLTHFPRHLLLTLSLVYVTLQDEYDLTPLMYSVWGGHVECVKYLVSNDFGVSKTGVKRSSLDMVSTKGYSALHLAGRDRSCDL
jgi:ankyrin repeat protein